MSEEPPESATGAEAAPDPDSDSDGSSSGGERSSTTRGRDVIVPMRVYKLVTVLSTAIAVPAVVVGFMFLDAATLQVSVMRRVVVSVLTALGVGVDEGALSAVLAVVGLALIGFGAGVYVLGARFRAAGMGNAEEDADEPSTNG